MSVHLAHGKINSSFNVNFSRNDSRNQHALLCMKTASCASYTFVFHYNITGLTLFHVYPLTLDVLRELASVTEISYVFTVN